MSRLVSLLCSRHRPSLHSVGACSALRGKLKDFYDSETVLPGLPGPRLLSARRRGQFDRHHRRPPARYSAVPGRRREIRPSDPPRLPHPLPRRLRRRPSGTARPLRRDHPSRLPRPGGIRLRGDEGRRYARLPGTAPASPRNPRPHHRVHLDPGLRSPERLRQNPTPSSPATLCSSATSAAPTCALRSGGQPTTSAPISTTRCTTGSCRFPTRRSSIRRMAPALSAGSSFPPIRSLRLEINGA